MARTAADVTPEEMERYRATLRRREAVDLAALRQREERAWEAAGKIAAFLRDMYGATRVVLFGSLARGHFFWRSDIDIAAWGVSDSAWLKASSDVLRIAGEFEANLLLAQDATPRIIAAIARDGREL